MGQSQSKDELVYQQVSYNNIEGIKALCREGAGLEVVSLVATIVEHLVTGKTMQMSTTADQRCSMEYYLEKTYYKTASLISKSYQLIALLAGHTADVAMLAYDYGKHLAITSWCLSCKYL